MSAWFNVLMSEQSYSLTAGSETQTSATNRPLDTYGCPFITLTSTKAVSLYTDASTNILYGYTQDISGTNISNNAAGEQNLGSMTGGTCYAIAMTSTTILAAGGSVIKQITESSGALSNSSNASVGTTPTGIQLCKLDSSYAVLFWREASTDVRCAVVTNASPPVIGTAYAVATGVYNTNGIIGLDSNYFIVGYTDSSNNMYIKIGYALSGAITYGSAVLISANITATSQITLVKHSSTTATIYYKQGSSDYGIKSKTITTSGTSATVGSEVDVVDIVGSTGYSPYRCIPVYNQNGVDVLFFANPDDTNYLDGSIVTGVAPADYTSAITSNNPCHPAGADYLTTDTLIVQYFKAANGLIANLYAKVVQVT